MGLDISIYKPEPLNGRDPQTGVENYFILSEHPELIDRFGKMAYEYSIEYFDVEGALKKRGLSTEDYLLAGWGTGIGGARLIVTHKHTGEEVEIKDPEMISKIESCIAVSEVGYQRKGANKQFYEDGMWDSPCVLSKDVLIEHWEKYFSHNTPESKGDGWGSAVEFGLTDEVMSVRFRENIIKKFIEGEHFVIYH